MCRLTDTSQLFIVGFHGHTPSDDIKTLIAAYHVGAVVLFGRNVANAAQLEALTKSLQEYAISAGHAQPLFIAIDQEGGLVTRIKSPIAAQVPGSMALGATGFTDHAYAASSVTAETLKSFGINMNYAPIADINSEPKNPVIGVRSPSDDPETVGRFVSAQANGLRDGGIVPCVKHFPGHGDTAVDSHHGLPVINKTKAKLEECEFVPFRRAAVEEIEAIMTAHIALPALGGDEGLPASLNPKAIAILRDEIQYDGLIVSDCLEMDGVRATFGTENGAVMALKVSLDT
jgi:beta-N-acetylhexosaminidase